MDMRKRKTGGKRGLCRCLALAGILLFGALTVGGDGMKAEYYREDFNSYATGSQPAGWMVVNPGTVLIEEVPSASDKSAALIGKSGVPARLIQQTGINITMPVLVSASFMQPEVSNVSQLLYLGADPYGTRNQIMQLATSGGNITIEHGGEKYNVSSYQANTWYTVGVYVEFHTRRLKVFVNGEEKLADKILTFQGDETPAIHRIGFRTDNTRTLYIDNVQIELDYAAMFESAAQALPGPWGDPDEVRRDLVLPTKGLYDVAVEWSSSNGDLIRVQDGIGLINRPRGNQAQDGTAVLTATLSHSGKSKSYSYTLTVKKMFSGTMLEEEFEGHPVGVFPAGSGWKSGADSDAMVVQSGGGKTLFVGAQAVYHEFPVYELIASTALEVDFKLSDAVDSTTLLVVGEAKEDAAFFVACQNNRLALTDADQAEIAVLAKDILAEKWYAFHVIVDPKSGTAQVYLDGERVLAAPVGLTKKMNFVGMVSFGGGAGFYVDRVKLYTLQAATLEISKSTSEIIRPEQGQIYAEFAALAKDNLGTVLSNEMILWEAVSRGGQAIPGMIPEDNGAKMRLPVAAGGASGDIDIKAWLYTDENIHAATLLHIIPLVITRVAIEGDGSIALSDSVVTQKKYTAVIEDQFGAAMTNVAVRWEVTGGSGVTIHEASGILTVQPTASAGAVTIWASPAGNPGLKTGKQVSLTKRSASYSGGNGARGSAPIPPSVTGGSSPEGNEAPASVQAFLDLENTLWAKDAVETLRAKGIVSGYGDNRFMPQSSVTREEFVKMLVTALQLEAAEKSGDFADVEEQDWYYPYVSTAKSVGIITGLEGGIFGAGQQITRQDMAVIVYRALRAKGVSLQNDSSGFGDSETISPYAREAVEKLRGNHIVAGRAEGFFDPAGQVTRAESAVIIYRIMNL